MNNLPAVGIRHKIPYYFMHTFTLFRLKYLRNDDIKIGDNKKRTIFRYILLRLWRGNIQEKTSLVDIDIKNYLEVQLC